MKTSRISLLYFLIFILLSISYLHADTFIVDNLSDIDDGNPYNVADGKNTLRKCIRLANDNPGNDYIIFNISGTISLTSALYPICDSITIDASSLWIGEWPGGKPGIILDGLNAGADADGIFISGANYCQIRGMFITNFKSNGIKIVADSSFNTIGGGGVGYRNVISENLNGIAILGTSGVPSNNIISGNYIGTDVDGTVDLGNSMHGVLIAGGAKMNFVGGSNDNERNVISGNDRRGINISGSDTDGNIILGNYLGTDFSGSKPLGNTRCGVAVEKGGRSNIIDGNIISGNNGNGIRIVDSGSDNNKILKNYIGTDRSGISNIGNTENGIYIHNGPQSNTVIENIIAFNGMVGIKIENPGTYQNRLSQNSIYNNIGLGIKLLDKSNNEISAPIILSARLEGDRIALSGNSLYMSSIVEFYKADSFDMGEGAKYIGSLETDNNLEFIGFLDISQEILSAGDPVVATITWNNDTSEFSVPFKIRSGDLRCRLKEGWNLISFSSNKCFYEGEIPQDIQVECLQFVNVKDKFNSLAEWFDSIIFPKNSWIVVMGENGVMFRGFSPEVNSLKYVSPTSGYWIKIAKGIGEAEFRLESIPFDANCDIPLNIGWNLVGYPLDIGYYDREPIPYIPGVEWKKVKSPVAAYVFNSIRDKYNVVFGSDGLYNVYLNKEANSLNYIAPYQAFWIKMKTPGILNYSKVEYPYLKP